MEQAAVILKKGEGRTLKAGGAFGGVEGLDL